MKVYVKYGSKPPFLPEAVADSKRELAVMLKKSLNCVQSAFSHNQKTYAEVEISDD